MIEVTYKNHMGDDLEVCDAARVSFAKEASNYTLEQNHKLLRYLAREKHFSPFGHVYAKFHVKAPLFVDRQLVKHRFLRWSEISRRYVDTPPEFYTPETWRKRAPNVKQGSSPDTVDFGILPCSGKPPHEYAYEEAHDTYDRLLGIGVCPEQARMVLPQSMMTEWVWSGSLDALANMAVLRLDSHTQYESRLVADQIHEKMRELFPVSWEALVGHE